MAILPAGANWPGWRGDGSGISADTRLPTAWTRTNGVLWRTVLPGEGSSSPIVWNSRIFLTASTDGGTNRLVICLDAHDGRVLWQRQVVAARTPRTDPKGGYAPATPVTDGARLYVFFDSPGLMAFDLEGRLLWTVPLGPFRTPYNITASPILANHRVIQCCDQSRDGFILAVDDATGGMLWKTPRALGCHYATPLQISVLGTTQVVAAGASVKAYDPVTGAEHWTCAGLTDTVAPSPVQGADGLVYATSGRNGPSLAIDPGGTGDVKESRMRLHVATGGPYVPSPIATTVLILPDDDGVIRIVNRQGVPHVAARIRDHFTASPLLAGTRLYWPAESGTTYVLDARRADESGVVLSRLAANVLDGRCLASPAIADGHLLIRTSGSLVCLAGSDNATPGGPPAERTGPSDDFASLKARFELHAAADGADIPVRLEVVASMAALCSSNAVLFLQRAAIKDAHWDVSEAAAKAVAASDTPATVPALLAMAEDHRGYIKVIAADGLGRVRAPEATAMLLKGVADPDPLVRIARLQALAAIATVPTVDLQPALKVLLAGLVDQDGPVRVAAAQGLATVATRLDADREAIARALNGAAADSNPLVAEAARQALISLARP